MTLQIRSARETLNVCLFVGAAVCEEDARMVGLMAVYMQSPPSFLCFALAVCLAAGHSIAEGISGWAGCRGLISVWLELKECMSSLKSTATLVLYGIK